MGADNWFIERLLSNSVGILDGAKKWVTWDPQTLSVVLAALEASRRPGVHVVPLNSCRTDAPVFAAVACAWERQASPGRRDAIILLTSDPSASPTANRIWIDPPGPSIEGKANLLSVAQAAAGFRGIQTKVRLESRQFPVRLVVADAIDDRALTALRETGVDPAALVVDGRTADIARLLQSGVFAHFPTTVVLAASPYQVPAAWKPFALPAAPARAGAPPARAAPLLCAPNVQPMGVVPVPVPDPLLEARTPLAELQALRGSRLAQEFADEATRLGRLITALPIRPSEVQRQFVRRKGYQAEPIQSGLDLLAHLTDATSDPDLLARFAQVMGAFTRALASLEQGNPKRDALFAALKKSENAIVVASHDGVARGLDREIRAALLIARVVRWKDPVTWIPHAGDAFLTSPPPRACEWVLTTPVASRVHLLYCEPEAAHVHRRLQQIGIHGGRGMEALQRLARPPPAPATPAPRPNPGPDSVLTFLRHGQGSSATEATATSPSNGEEGPVQLVRIDFESGDRFYARAGSQLAAVVRGGARMTSIHDLKPSSLILLSVANPALNVLDAAFQSFENRPAHAPHVRTVREWKKAVAAHAAARSWGAHELSDELRRLGAAELDPRLVRRIFLADADDDQIAALKPEALVRATCALLSIPHEINAPRIVRGIKRLRGIHRAAGRFLTQLATLGYLATQDELDQRLDDELGLTLADLRSMVRPFTIRTIGDPFTGPTRLAGFLTEDEDQGATP